MPASSSSLVISTSIYLFSSTIFLGMAYSPVQSSLHSADLATVRNVADGIQWQLDSLSPGMVVSLSWGQTLFQVPTAVSLSGHSLIVSFRDFSAVRILRWALPSMVLEPGIRYSATLQGDEVRIAQSGFG